MTAHPDTAHQRLESRRARTSELIRRRREAGSLDETQAGSTSELSDVDQHPADVGSETAERELTIGTIEDLRARIDEIDEAFERLRTGSYGSCQTCGRPISGERLEVIPEASFCSNHH